MTRRRLAACCLAVAAFAALVSPAAAQDDGPMPIAPFRLVDWSGKLFLNAQYRQEDESSGGVTSSTTDQFFEEGVELSGQGYIYHPNLVDWNLSLRMGLTQQAVDTDTTSHNSDGRLLGYDLSALILRTKPVSFRVFGSMSDQFISRTFARPLDVTTRTEGFEVFTHDDIPMSLLFEHTDSLESSNLRDEDKESYYVKYLVTDRRTREWFSELKLEYEDTDEQLTFYNPGGGAPTTSDQPDTRMEANFSNRWQFGPQALRHDLSGTARVLHRTGTFEQDFYLIDQRLTLRHDPTLSSFYVGHVSNSETEEQTEQNFAGQAGVRKQFYESLSLVGSVNGSTTQYDDGKEDSYGGAFDADYRKKTPIGLYSSTLHLSRQYDSDSFAGGSFRVLDEGVVMSVTIWQRLARPNVQAGTVVVTNLANTITFIEGVDYDLRTIGSFTEIRITFPVGGIADGDAVLVDYTVDESPDAVSHTDSIETGHRIDLKAIPLSLYTEYRIQKQELDSGSDPGNFEQSTAFLGGADLTLGPCTLSAEYEWVDQELSPPWTAYRGRFNYTQALGRDTSANATAYYEMLKYRDADRFGLEPGRDFRETYGATASVTTRVQQGLLVRVEGEYRESRGQDNQTLIRIGPDITWQYGLTEISVSGYHQMYTQEDREGTSQYVNFRLTRRF